MMFDDHESLELTIFDREVLRQCMERGPVLIGNIASEKAAQGLRRRGLLTITSCERRAAYAITEKGIARYLAVYPETRFEWNP